jgi:hypothetical protein
MVKIQLIEFNEGYLDVDDNSVVPLNFSVSEIRDLSKKKGAYSKTITLAGTKNNNKLLNNYFEVNIVSGEFNVSKKQPCIILQDGVTILDNCILQLLNVKINKNLVSYEVSIKDTSSDFFQTIAGLEITDLDFTDLNHVVNATNIIASFSNTEGYKYGLGANETNAYNINQTMPCLFVKTIWDRLFQRAGYTYEFDELTTIGFDKLLLPYVGDGVNVVDNTDELVQANRLTPYSTAYSQPTIGLIQTFTEPIILDNEIIDVNGNYNPITGVYTTPYNIQGSDSLNVNVSMTYELSLTTIGTAIYGEVLQGATDPIVIKPVFAIGNLTPLLGFVEASPIQLEVGYSFTSSVLLTTGQLNATIPLNQLLSGALLNTRIGIRSEQGSIWVDDTPAENPKSVNAVVNITSIDVSFIPNVTVAVQGATVNANSLLPIKLKQSDFIKSIAQMFNLFIDTDKFNSRNLIIKTRDKYYDDGVSKDWTLKIAKDREQQLSFLSDVTSKKYLLTYKQDKDQYNEIYQKNVNEIYGQIEYTFDSEFVKDTQTNELIFSPTPIGQTTFGAVVPYISYPAPKLNFRILFDGGVFSCGDYTIDGTVVNTYPSISHFNNPNLPTYDINFAICDFYFLQNVGLTNNNLYNLYWRRTLGQINKGKLLSALFNLSEVDINQINLSDRIYIGNTVWNINRIIDYDANSRELTRVELISVDEESSLIPFLETIPTQTNPKLPPIYTSNAGGGIIQGNGNQQGNTGVIIGNGNNNQGGGIIQGNRNQSLSNALILGNDNVVNESLPNVMILGDNYTATQSNALYVDAINDVPVSSIIGSSFWVSTANNSFYSSFGGNSIDALSEYSSIVGGQDNIIRDSLYSSIIGGKDNTISSFNYVVMLGTNNLTALYDNTTYQADSYRDAIRLVTTTNNTTTNLHTFTPINGVYILEAKITGFESATGDSITINAYAGFKVIAGVVTQISTTSLDRKSNFPASVTAILDTDGTNIRVRVKGRTGSTIDWKSTINIIK